MAVQFLILHCDDYLVEVWRFQDFPENFWIMYRANKWTSVWFDTQIPLLLTLTMLYLEKSRPTKNNVLKMLFEASNQALAVYGLTYAGK